MDTDLLKAFVTVAEEASFSLAAEKLHITQPAVSKRIALLEEQLSCRLFDRIPRAVALTEAGKTLLPRATSILQQVSETQQIIDDLSEGVTGTLRLAISHHIGLHRIPGVLKNYVHAYPDVAIDVDFNDSEIAYEKVQQGQFEIAVITLAPEDPPNVISSVTWHDPLVLVTSTEHPLTKQTGISVEQLSEHPAILPATNTYTGKMIREHFQHSGYSLNASMATNYLETIKMMVSVGLGWSFLPASMVDSSLCSMPCKGIDLYRQLGYIHHRERTLSQAAMKFIELLNNSADHNH